MSQSCNPPEPLLVWLSSMLLCSPPDLSVELIVGDASPRKYYRVTVIDAEEQASTLIAVDSPASEKNPEFLHIRSLLEAAGIQVPTLFASDLNQGWLLLSDLGDRVLLPELSSESVDGWYAKALDALCLMANIDTTSAGLEPYDATRLQAEMDLFTEWFVPRLLGMELIEEAAEVFARLSTYLVASATEQPQVFVHRDFHSRNLMIVDEQAASLAVIDFQDAVIGPITYDPVSLLKDCYIRWPRAQQLEWLRCHQLTLEASNLMAPVDSATFIRWFDLMGLQRHLKVLGIFARLWLRDGKPGYLNDLPLVLAYTREVLSLYQDSEPVIAAFADWFEQEVIPACEKQRWFHELPVSIGG